MNVGDSHCCVTNTTLHNLLSTWYTLIVFRHVSSRDTICFNFSQICVCCQYPAGKWFTAFILSFCVMFRRRLKQRLKSDHQNQVTKLQLVIRKQELTISSQLN
ncbi:hypothetical protein EB796_013597 [Bugula neritina]|uniref:Uncharacterized protein n=1 Tax=Bugula neritina TaxID=10212 RepID=A0A7J7JRM3_BUGNE|nr:hypothetical protein EB796_013597 [Bugula neritina]